MREPSEDSLPFSKPLDQIAALLPELQRSGELSLPTRRELVANVQVALAEGRRTAVFLGGRYSPQSGKADLEISPDEWDTGFLASLAAAGGATWEGVGDSEARLAFWEWYLVTAVPEAFKVAADL